MIHDTLQKINHARGFSLLVAVIFMSVMLAFGIALGSLAYKQVTLASTATESQYAFYAADGALECILEYDQQTLDQTYPYFDYTYHDANHAPLPVTCNTQTTGYSSFTRNGSQLVVSYQIPIEANRCAEVTIYKYNGTQVINGKTVSTYIFSQGYNVACASIVEASRVVSRGEDIYY